MDEARESLNLLTVIEDCKELIFEHLLNICMQLAEFSIEYIVLMMQELILDYDLETSTCSIHLHELFKSIPLIDKRSGFDGPRSFFYTDTIRKRQKNYYQNLPYVYENQ